MCFQVVTGIFWFDEVGRFTGMNVSLWGPSHIHRMRQIHGFCCCSLVFFFSCAYSSVLFICSFLFAGYCLSLCRCRCFKLYNISLMREDLSAIFYADEVLHARCVIVFIRWFFGMQIVFCFVFILLGPFLFARLFLLLLLLFYNITFDDVCSICLFLYMPTHCWVKRFIVMQRYSGFKFGFDIL